MSQFVSDCELELKLTMTNASERQQPQKHQQQTATTTRMKGHRRHDRQRSASHTRCCTRTALAEGATDTTTTIPPATTTTTTTIMMIIRQHSFQQTTPFLLLVMMIAALSPSTGGVHILPFASAFVPFHRASFNGNHIRLDKRPSRPQQQDERRASLNVVASKSTETKTAIAAGTTTTTSIPAVPRHVAFICDGNSRWATKRGLPASAGHAAGADRLLKCLQSLRSVGVECCTMYGFSTENWKRPEKEIKDILMVVEETGKRFHRRAVEEGVRVRILGDLDDDRIPTSLRQTLRALEDATHTETSGVVDGSGHDNDKLTVCLAINYGGRQDILQAARQLAESIASGDIDPDELTEDDVSDSLYTSGIPDPDLVIRTGGDQRMSNFLLWNTAYTELYFTDTLWPDFDEACVLKAIDWYGTRNRRFGGRKDEKAVVTR